MASAGPHANHSGQVPFLPPNQQRQSTEGMGYSFLVQIS